VAREMNVSVNTIKTQLSRGLRLLRERLEGEGFLLLLLLSRAFFE
jgi:DNA-directed RNA polymerase specialized sigma24 family protein